MTDFEIEYSLADTKGLHEAMTKLMQAYNDNIKTIPLTSTGYVRREAREHMRKDEHNRFQFQDEQLSVDAYKLCKMAVRGGNTHASWQYTGEILENVYSYDRVSSYPAIMVSKKYPVGKGTHERNVNLHEPIKGVCSIMLVEYQGIKLRQGIYFPYISVSKLQFYQRGKAFLNDNGRLIESDRVILAITEIDYEIIKNQYTYDEFTIYEQIVYRQGYLPSDYREFIVEYFRRKCELKNGDKYYYDKIKNKFNALFGMMLTDICREQVDYFNHEWVKELPDLYDSLKKYYRNSNSFLSYQHGIYVTAHARWELQRGFDIVGSDGVYGDTDSVKFVGNHAEDFQKLNESIHRENMECDIKPIVTVNGKEYELGLWEDEGNGKPFYKRFITHGAKKYAYEYPDGKIGITVAGVNKGKGAEYLTRVGLEKFENGLVFDPTYSGRLTSKFDDEIRLDCRYINGHYVELTSSMALVPTTYELGITEDYEKTFKILREGY